MQELQRMISTARKGQQIGKYQALIGIADQVVSSARRVLKRTQRARGRTLAATLAIAALREDIEHYCSLGDRVIDQSRRRVLEGEKVDENCRIAGKTSPSQTKIFGRARQQATQDSKQAIGAATAVDALRRC
jgi:hypothetical protein